MYYLSKIHKSTTRPPGRPIISGIDSISSRIGRYIDFFLQPLVCQAPSYLKDTGDTIRRLASVEYQDNLILVMADVTALYTCIPHKLRLEAMEHYLAMNNKIPPIQQSFVMELLQFATLTNYFWYNNQFFL